MRIFLTGATGYIGSAVARALMRAGHDVSGLTRSRDRAAELAAAGMNVVVGDLSLPKTYASAAAACDTLIHAGFEFGPRAERTDQIAVKTLLDCAGKPGDKRLFVYTSGVWVLGPCLNGEPADEAAHLRPPAVVAWRPAHERLALEAAGPRLAAVVVRPGCVYGGSAGLYGAMFKSLFDERVIRLVGDGTNRWASVYLDDLAELYRLLVEARPSGEVFHAADGSAEMVENVAAAFIDAAGGGEIEKETVERARRRLGVLAEAVAMDQRVSSEKARRELGWKPVMGSAGLNAEAVLSEWREKTFGPAVA